MDWPALRWLRQTMRKSEVTSPEYLPFSRDVGEQSDDEQLDRLIPMS